MFRTIMATIFVIIISVVIVVFQAFGLTTSQLEAILGDANALKSLGALVFYFLLTPYTAATAATPIYSPIIALAVSGFIAGLISKSGVRMFFASIFSIAVFFVAVALIAGYDTSTWTTIAKNMAADLGAAFGAVFIPGAIGASLTAD